MKTYCNGMMLWGEEFHSGSKAEIECEICYKKGMSLILLKSNTNEIKRVCHKCLRENEDWLGEE